MKIPQNAWIGVLLITMGLIAIVVFSWLKIPEGATAISVVVLGVGIIQGISHQETSKALDTLRKSIRPPSLVDEAEKLYNPNVPRETLLSQKPQNPDEVRRGK